MPSGTLSTLSVDLTTSSAALYAGLQQANQQVRNYAERSSEHLRSLARNSAGISAKITKNLTGIGAVASTALAIAGGAAVKFAEEQAEAYAELEKNARLSNTTVENFQNMAFATKAYGIEQDKLSDIFKDSREKLGEFVESGGGGMADFFDMAVPKIYQSAEAMEALKNNVDLNSEAFLNLPADQLLVKVKSALDAANISAEAQSFYLESLASDATLLMPLLENGGARLQELATKASQVNVGLTTLDSQRLRELNESANLVELAFDSLQNQLTAKLAPFAMSAFDSMSEHFGKFSRGLASGEVQGYIQAIKISFSDLNRYYQQYLSFMQEKWSQVFSFLGDSTNTTTNDIKNAFFRLPQNIVLVVRSIATEFSYLVDYAKAHGQAFVDRWVIYFDDLKNKAGVYGREIADKLKFWDGDSYNFAGELASVNAQMSQGITDVYANTEKQIDSLRRKRLLSMNEAVNEYQTNVANTQAQVDSAKKLGEIWQENQKIKNAANDNDNSNITSINNSGATKLGVQLDNSAFDQAKTIQQRLDNFSQDKYEQQLNWLKDRYDREKDIIVQAHGEQSDLEIKLTSEYEIKKKEIQQAQLQERLGMATQFFGNMHTIASAAFGRESKAAKMMAISQTIMETWKGAQSAFSALAVIPIVGPALGAAAAGAAVIAGMQRVNQIRNQKTPSYMGGGHTGKGSRTGGVDGFGGFHALVHPEEFIFDTRKPAHKLPPLTASNDPERPATQPPQPVQKNYHVTLNAQAFDVHGLDEWTQGAGKRWLQGEVRQILTDDKRP